MESTCLIHKAPLQTLSILSAVLEDAVCEKGVKDEDLVLKALGLGAKAQGQAASISGIGGQSFSQFQELLDFCRRLFVSSPALPWSLAIHTVPAGKFSDTATLAFRVR